MGLDRQTESGYFKPTKTRGAPQYSAQEKPYQRFSVPRPGVRREKYAVAYFSLGSEGNAAAG